MPHKKELLRSLWVGCSPKGPCTQIVYTLPFQAKVYAF